MLNSVPKYTDWSGSAWHKPVVNSRVGFLYWGINLASAKPAAAPRLGSLGTFFKDSKSEPAIPLSGNRNRVLLFWRLDSKPGRALLPLPRLWGYGWGGGGGQNAGGVGPGGPPKWLPFPLLIHSIIQPQASPCSSCNCPGSLRSPLL